MSKDDLKILICEDQEILRTGLRLILNSWSGVELVGEACNGEECISLTEHYLPDVILMDIEMPKLNGIDATRIIKTKFPQTRVVVFTTFSRDDDIYGAFAAGADAYCLKTVSPDHLLSAVRAVAEGAAWLDPMIADRVLRGSPPTPARSASAALVGGPGKNLFNLSERELTVLKLVVDGLSNAEIAKSMCVSTETVKTHMRHILEKLSVSDRTQAAVKAMKEGLF